MILDHPKAGGGAGATVASAKRLTVVTTAYRPGPLLTDYFRSVRGLTGLEQMRVCLVLNDASPDERRVARAEAERRPDLFHVMEVARESIGASLNRGFAWADTPYVAILDVDDVRVPDAFLKQMDVLDRDTTVDFTYGDFVVVPRRGVTEGRHVTTPSFDREEFQRSCVASPTQVFRRGLVDGVGGFDEQFRSGGDYEFQIRAAQCCRFRKTQGVMAYYTKEAGAESASSSRLQPVERTAIELRYGLYDKTMALEGYEYLDEARRYRLGEVLYRQRWYPLSDYLSGYEMLLAEKADALGDLLRHESSWRRRQAMRRALGFQGVPTLAKKLQTRRGTGGR